MPPGEIWLTNPLLESGTRGDLTSGLKELGSVILQCSRESCSMPPIRLNRRRFLGCSAAASLALSQGNLAEAAAVEADTTPVRLGVIGIGNRGTALLRALLELPGTPIVAVCDFDPRHRQRGQGI